MLNETLVAAKHNEILFLFWIPRLLLAPQFSSMCIYRGVQVNHSEWHLFFFSFKIIVKKEGNASKDFLHKCYKLNCRVQSNRRWGKQSICSSRFTVVGWINCCRIPQTITRFSRKIPPHRHILWWSCMYSVGVWHITSPAGSWASEPRLFHTRLQKANLLGRAHKPAMGV